MSRKTLTPIATALALAAAGIAIAATVWLTKTSAQESTRSMTTTTATASSTANLSQPVAATSPSASPSPALQTQTVTAAAAPAQEPSAPSTAGQRAFLDPATGQLRQPEHEELAAIAAEAAAGGLARRATGRTATTAAATIFDADGAVSAMVPEELHTFTVATRGPDGRIVIQHAQGAASAARMVKAHSAKNTPRASVSRAQQEEDRNDR